jgi:hypothetical protein
MSDFNDDEENGRPTAQFKSTPRPDPTQRTEEQLFRTNKELEKLLTTRVIALEKEINARLGGMDKALVLLQAKSDRSPSIDEVVARFEERFKATENQFKERDTRSDQSLREGKIAVDAAFAAQKEAVSEQNKSSTAAIAKSEAATTKQIDAWAH